MVALEPSRHACLGHSFCCPCHFKVIITALLVARYLEIGFANGMKLESRKFSPDNLPDFKVDLQPRNLAVYKYTHIDDLPLR